MGTKRLLVIASHCGGSYGLALTNKVRSSERSDASI